MIFTAVVQGSCGGKASIPTDKDISSLSWLPRCWPGKQVRYQPAAWLVPAWHPTHTHVAHSSFNFLGSRWPSISSRGARGGEEARVPGRQLSMRETGEAEESARVLIWETGGSPTSPLCPLITFDCPTGCCPAPKRFGLRATIVCVQEGIKVKIKNIINKERNQKIK